MTEWIKCSERLPQKEGMYLTCYYKKAYQSGFFTIDEQYKVNLQKFFMYEDQDFYNIDGYVKATKRVLNPRFLEPALYWSEMPKPPENA